MKGRTPHNSKQENRLPVAKQLSDATLGTPSRLASEEIIRLQQSRVEAGRLRTLPTVYTRSGCGARAVLLIFAALIILATKRFHIAPERERARAA